MKQVNLLIEDEAYELLTKEAGKRQALTGKKTYITKIICEQIEPYLTNLRNGTSPDIKQTSEQPESAQSPKDRHNMDFSDLDLG